MPLAGDFRFLVGRFELHDDGAESVVAAHDGDAGSVRAVGAYGIYVTGDLVMGCGTVVAHAENGNGIQADGLLVRGGAIDSVGSSRGIYVKKDGMTVLGGTVSAVCSSLWATGIYVANGDIAVRGGSVVAAGNKSAAIYVRNGGFAMSGGAVTATSADASDGINASGDIVLGWTDPADFILAGSYTSASGAVSVQKGQTFADEGGNLYEGELDSGELAAARGKTLRPYIADTPPYAAWAAASGVSGAWDETDALGIYNVFRYAFDKPAGAFTNPPLLDIAFDGTTLVLTPPAREHGRLRPFPPRHGRPRRRQPRHVPPRPERHQRRPGLVLIRPLLPPQGRGAVGMVSV